MTMDGETETKAYTDMPGYEKSKTYGVYNSAFYITITALVLGIIGLITAILTGIGKLSGKIAAVFLLLTFVFTLVAPSYFAVALPEAMKEDSSTWDKGFMGSEEIAGVKVSWGPGYGWYLAVAAFVLTFIAMIFAVKMPKKVAPPLPKPERVEEEKIKERLKESARTLYNAGASLASSGKYKEAIEYYDKALAIIPDDVEVWNYKGVALAHLRQYDEAIKCYDRALLLAPNYVAAWDNKGTALYNLKQYEEALKCYDQALAINPGYELARKGREIVPQHLE